MAANAPRVFLDFRQGRIQGPVRPGRDPALADHHLAHETYAARHGTPDQGHPPEGPEAGALITNHFSVAVGMADEAAS
jgi:hypothetical protein